METETPTAITGERASFSQNREDEVFVKLLPKVGRMMEIGAFHPIDLSNSRALIMAGWDAVLVEANPLSLKNLVDFYRTTEPNPKVVIVNALVTVNLEPEIVPFQLCWDAVSTTESHHFDLWKNTVKYFETYMITTPIEQLFRAFHGHYNFVSVDVEGASCSLGEYVLKEIKPDVAVVEHQEKDRNYLKAFAEYNGYYTVSQNAENYIFVRKDYTLPEAE